MSLIFYLTILGISFLMTLASYYQSIFLEGGLYGLVEVRHRLHEKSIEKRGEDLFSDGCVSWERSDRLGLTSPLRFSNCAVQVFRGVEQDPLFVCDASRFYPGRDKGDLLPDSLILGRAPRHNMVLGDSIDSGFHAALDPSDGRVALSPERSEGARSGQRFRVIFRCPRAPWGWPRDATQFTLALKG